MEPLKPSTNWTPAMRPADKLRSRFLRRRFSLAAAIQEDAALEGLNEAEILEQVRSKVRLQQKKQSLFAAKQEQDNEQ
jgi:hypothetical protein